MDLENFIILGSKFANQDSRTFTSFTHICIKLAPILSPFKLKKIVNEIVETEDEFKILGFILETIQENVRSKNQWQALIKECKEKANTKKQFKLFDTSSFKSDLKLSNWGLVSSKLELECPDKYLDQSKLFKVSIIKNRFLGMKVVYSDLLFYKECHENTKSLNQISKKIYHDYNSVYQANENIKIAS